MPMLRAVNTMGRLGIMPVAVTPMTSALIRSQHSAISVGLPRTLDRLTVSPAIATAQGTAAFTTHEAQPSRNVTRDIGTKPDIAANVKEDDSRPGDNPNVRPYQNYKSNIRRRRRFEMVLGQMPYKHTISYINTSANPVMQSTDAGGDGGVSKHDRL